MRCKKCDYALWNLPARQCPECGEPFLPSEFEFIPNSVTFRCPYCEQPYYGTGPTGHLVPTAFDCANCGAAVHMDQMVLFPTEGVEEAQTQVYRVPWLQRRRRGFFRGWGQTVWHVMIGPMRLMRAVPAESSLGQAWWFGLLSQTTTLFVITLMIGCCCGGMFGMISSRVGGPGGILIMTSGLGSFLVFTLVTLVVMQGIIALWGAVTQGMLRITGGAANSIGRTYQALCYSSGAVACSIVPIIGTCFGWIWWVVSAILMVKEAQRVHGGRAALAVLTLPVTVILGVVGLYVVMIYIAITTVGTMTTTATTAFTPQAQPVLTAIVDYAGDHQGQEPAHAIQLVADGYLQADQVIWWMTGMTLADVPIANITMEKFQLLSSQQQQQVAQAAAAALLEGTIAHRLGDFVFTYHGIDPSVPESAKLWLVIYCPENIVPAVSPGFPGPAGDRMFVGLADGTVTELDPAKLDEFLDVQNQLRQDLGLAPLPDPATVTHQAPAVQSAETPVRVQ